MQTASVAERLRQRDFARGKDGVQGGAAVRLGDLGRISRKHMEIQHWQTGDELLFASIITYSFNCIH